MKIKFPFLKNKSKEKDIIKKTQLEILSNLDFQLIYKAYKKYVLEVDNILPELIEFKQEDNPKISIIIPVYNQFELTVKCLNSIKKGTKTPYEIILVDDCSTDKTAEIENFVKGIKIIRNKQNLGYLKNNNLAAKTAKGKYLYLLNNDTYLFEGAIDFIFDDLEKNSQIGACGSKLIFPDGKLQSVGSVIYKDGGTFPIGYMENPLNEEFNSFQTVDFCCGASLMVRKNLWDKLNGFDELFLPAYYEETDLCMRIKEMGYIVACEPKSEIIHYTSQTFGEKTAKLISQNREKFYKKWKHKLIQNYPLD